MRLWISALLFAAGCATSAEDLSPLGADAGDAGQTTLDAGAGGTGTGTGGTGGAGGQMDAGPPKRTMIVRNPFGNVAETQNLLWDGDFEWHSAFSDQYGWLAGSSPASLDYNFTDVRLGAVCRSGLKCAGMKKGRVIAGIGVASAGNKLQVSFWAKVQMGSCSDVEATIIAYDSTPDPDVVIPPVTDAPDATGWCQYQSVLDARLGKPILYIANQTGADVIIDDAVVKKVAPEMSVNAHHGPPSAALAQDLAMARVALLRARGPHDPPKNQARRAFEGRKGNRP